MENFDTFAIRHQIAYGAAPPTTAGLAYDAAMAALLAMVPVAADTSPTGTALATNMARLVDPAGTAISFGGPTSSFIPTARLALAGGGGVDLQGVSGALDWDPSNGETRTNVLGWSLVGTVDAPALSPSCIYLLNAAPAVTGFWLSTMTGMPPCN